MRLVVQAAQEDFHDPIVTCPSTALRLASPNLAIVVPIGRDDDLVICDSAGLKIIFPDGRSIMTGPWRAGAVYWASAPGRQQQEDPFDTRLEFIAIEPKGC